MGWMDGWLGDEENRSNLGAQIATDLGMFSIRFGQSFNYVKA